MTLTGLKRKSGPRRWPRETGLKRSATSIKNLLQSVRGRVRHGILGFTSASFGEVGRLYFKYLFVLQPMLPLTTFLPPSKNLRRNRRRKTRKIRHLPSNADARVT
jgi:hypothetical protein